LIGLYLGQAAPGSAYGTAGSFVVLLVWIYYSSQIMLLGAQFTQVYANLRGTGRMRDLRRSDSPSSRDSVAGTEQTSPNIGTPIASISGNSLGRTE
jgi:membrane protein